VKARNADLGSSAAAGRADPRSPILLGLFIAGLVAAISPSAAPAEEIGGLKSLNVAIYGRIDERCAVGAIDSVDFGDLTRPGGRTHSQVSLDCNVPISVTVSAAHGALANDRYPAGQGPYAGSVRYSLGFKVPVRRPSQSVVLRNFRSGDLVGAGQTFTTGDGIAVDGMSLEVALEKPTAEAGLLAGSYGDTIEITVTPG
jgi:spore coat protein U-like protein